MSSARSIFHADTDQRLSNVPAHATTDATLGSNPVMSTRKDYSGLMKLIVGCIAGTFEYGSIYKDLNNNIREKALGDASSMQTPPSLVEIARKLAQQQGTKMDKKQYVTYKFICCNFLLGLVNGGRDPNSTLKSHLQQALSEREDKRDMTNYLIEELNTRGGQEQLIMFLIVGSPR